MMTETSQANPEAGAHAGARCSERSAARAQVVEGARHCAWHLHFLCLDAARSSPRRVDTASAPQYELLSCPVCSAIAVEVAGEATVFRLRHALIGVPAVDLGSVSTSGANWRGSPPRIAIISGITSFTVAAADPKRTPHAFARAIMPRTCTQCPVSRILLRHSLCPFAS